ncbi:MAG: PAS domain S-box protein [Cytophagales bacterium]|nr:MAG: PAS domain S-box protein [Cytophagales bacterium]
MISFQQFDISDFLNELDEPVMLLDAEEILYFNTFFLKHYQPLNENWKSYFSSPEIGMELDHFFQTGKKTEAKFTSQLITKGGGDQSIEWSFYSLPSSYTSHFLIAKGLAKPKKSDGQQDQILNSSRRADFMQSILNNSYDLIAILDEKGKYKFISDSVSEKLGFPPESILGNSYLDWIEKGSIELVKGSFEEVLKSKDKEVPIDFWVRLPSGKRVYLESFAKNLLDHPDIQGIMFSSRDITEFIETERSLTRRFDIENLINQISSQMISANLTDLEEQLDLSLEKFGQFFNAQQAEVVIINKETKELEIISSWTSSTENKSITAGPRYFSLLNSVKTDLENGKVKLSALPSTSSKRGVKDQVEIIFIPLLSEEKLLGLVQFEIENPSFPILEKEIQVLRQLGDIIAGAYLGNLILRKLERNENLLASTEVLSKSGSWRYSAFRDKFYFSAGFSQLLEIGDKSQYVDAAFLLYKIDKPFRERFIQDLKKASAQLTQCSGEFTITKSGSSVRYFHYEIVGKKEYLSQGLEVYGFCSDITQKRISDNNLRLQSQILAQVVDPIMVVNEDLEVIYLNEAAIQLCCPETSRSFKGRIEDLIDFGWDSGERLIDFIQNLNVGEVWKTERHLATVHTSRSPFEVSARAIHAESEEKIGYSLIFRNLEEKYKSEQIAQRARLIVENSPAVLFRVNPSKNYKIKYISQNISRFGYNAEELIEQGVSFLDLIYPEDLETLLAKANVVKGDMQGLAFSGEYRIVKPDGSLVWVEDRTSEVYDELGKVYLHEGLFQDISDRKNFEMVQEQRDRQYRMLASNIPDTNIFLLDKNRRYILAEGTNFEKWGLKKEDFEGKYLKDFQLTEYEQVNEILNRVYENQEIVESEFFLKDRYYQRIIRPIVENGQVEFALSIVRDIHSEYQAKVNLKQSEEKYRRLVEESTEIIFSLSEAYLLHYVSPNVKQFLGYDSEEVIGRSIFEFIHLDDLDVFQKMISETQDFLAKNQFLEFRLRHKNGEYRVFNSNGKLIEDKQGIHRYYTGVARDISKLKEAQKELLIAKEKAELASQAKSQFLSVMSHEIRTPMNAVIGLAHFLMEEDPRPDQLENLKTLQFSAENLMALINDILDYNKIDSGKVELEKAPFEIRNMVHRIVHSHSFLANDKGLKIYCEVDESIPQVIYGDALRLGQVMNNLVSNAIKFTEKGFVRIQISREFVQGSLTEIKFSFEDTGIGIPKEKVKTIFEAFTQASSSTSRKYGGTGLGLAIVKRLVELFGGEIEVHARSGGGSIFEFTLPFEFDDEKAKSMEKTLIQNQRSLHNASILVAEDNSVNQILIRKFLTKWNTGSWVIASDGKEALEAYEKGDFDLVLLDLQMPELDGFEVANTIRGLNDERKSKVPILALTAASINEIKDELAAAGFNDFIPKPFSPEGLYDKIFKYLNTKESIE